jgi:hypothetical protein
MLRNPFARCQLCIEADLRPISHRSINPPRSHTTDPPAPQIAPTAPAPVTGIPDAGLQPEAAIKIE